MSCNTVSRGDLDAYVTGELPAPEARSVEAHLFGCSECATELRRLRAERRLFRARAEQDAAAVPSFEGVLARIDGSAGKGASGDKGARTAGWTSRLAPAGVAAAALAAAAASWVGVRHTPIDAGPGAREEVEEVGIGPDRVCTSEGLVSEEPTASVVPAAQEIKSGAVGRGREDLGVCGSGDGPASVCGPENGAVAEACDEAVAWCSAARP